MARLRFTDMKRPSDGGVCFCCLRRDEGAGFPVPNRHNRIIWSCNDHIPLGRKAAAMPQAEFDIYEKQSLEAAGNKAGQMLDDKYGKTDLADLEFYEYLDFCKTLVKAFGDELAARLQSYDPPF